MSLFLITVQRIGGKLRRSLIKTAAQFLLRQDIRDVQRAGYHFQRNDYYSPLNELDFLDRNRDLWNGGRDPADVDWNAAGQLMVANEVAEYVEELSDVPEALPETETGYCWRNNFWNNADALVQYGLIRSRKPRRYVEIGCGWSSMLLQRALEKNGTPCEVTLIEPYPNERIFSTLPKEWSHCPLMLQRAPLETFESLSAGDVLFYDGSHCSKAASDVNFFFFEVLPRVQSGVLIHFHDIFLPDDYPEEWIFHRGQTWNEQYLLQAFLMNNDRYRVLIANRWLFRRSRDLLDGIYRGIQPSYGCSLWIIKK